MAKQFNLNYIYVGIGVINKITKYHPFWMWILWFMTKYMIIPQKKANLKATFWWKRPYDLTAYIIDIIWVSWVLINWILTYRVFKSSVDSLVV